MSVAGTGNGSATARLIAMGEPKRMANFLTWSSQPVLPSTRVSQVWCETIQGRLARSSGQIVRRLMLFWMYTSLQSTRRMSWNGFGQRTYG